jgi:hypothetical protein
MNRIHAITIFCRRIIASCRVLTVGPGLQVEIPSRQTRECPVAGPGSSLRGGGLSEESKISSGRTKRAGHRVKLAFATSSNVQRRSGAAQGTAKATPGRPWSAVDLPGSSRGTEGGRCAWFGLERQERPICLACVSVRYPKAA